MILEGGDSVSDYKKPYYILFNAITNSLEAIEQRNLFQARLLLIRAQQDAEEAFLQETDKEEKNFHE